MRKNSWLINLSLFQRYRYSEAYQVHIKLEKVEQDFISKGSISQEFLPRLETAIQWRANLVVSNLNFSFEANIFWHRLLSLNHVKH